MLLRYGYSFARTVVIGDSLGAPALGQRFIIREELREVVGVVEDGKYHQMQEPPQAAIYIPLSQNEETWPILVVRSQRTKQEMTPALERTLTSLEPDAQITVQSWPEIIAGALFPARPRPLLWA